MKVLIAHPGTQHANQLVTQLERLGILYQFWTGFAISQDSITNGLLRILPSLVLKKLNKRIIDIPSSSIRIFPGLELKALIHLRIGNTSAERIFYLRNESFQRSIPDKAILQCDVVIGFDTSSWILADRCKKMGKRFILDSSIAHPASKARVYQRIAIAYPEWSFDLNQKPDKLIELEQHEMSCASDIVVASSFARKTLVENGVAKEKISVIPYGVDELSFRPHEKSKKHALKFVFVGLVDARKGIPLLLDVWKEMMPSATLTLIGPIAPNVKALIEQEYPFAIIRGRMAHSELMNELPDYDIMIFPSYFEGFGLVILESMACGVPVITTDATCGPDVISNDLDGVVVESGNRDQLSKAIMNFTSNPDNAVKMGRESRSRALAFTWEDYGKHWENIIFKIYDQQEN